MTNYSHPDKLCLNVYHVTFDYSNLDAHTSKTKNDKNKQISYFESNYGLGKILYNWHTWTEGCAEVQFYLPT